MNVGCQNSIATEQKTTLWYAFKKNNLLHELNRKINVCKGLFALQSKSFSPPLTKYIFVSRIKSNILHFSFKMDVIPFQTRLTYEQVLNYTAKYSKWFMYAEIKTKKFNQKNRVHFLRKKTLCIDFLKKIFFILTYLLQRIIQW